MAEAGPWVLQARLPSFVSASITMNPMESVCVLDYCNDIKHLYPYNLVLTVQTQFHVVFMESWSITADSVPSHLSKLPCWALLEEAITSTGLL